VTAGSKTYLDSLSCVRLPAARWRWVRLKLFFPTNARGGQRGSLEDKASKPHPYSTEGHPAEQVSPNGPFYAVLDTTLRPNCFRKSTPRGILTLFRVTEVGVRAMADTGAHV